MEFRETLCRCERQTIDKLVKRIVPATYNFSHCALIPQLPDQYYRCVIIRRIEVQLQCILDIATTHAQFVKWDRICGQLLMWSILVGQTVDYISEMQCTKQQIKNYEKERILGMLICWQSLSSKIK